jgi:hypothetical protein
MCILIFGWGIPIVYTVINRINIMNKGQHMCRKKPLYYHIISLLHVSALQRRHFQGVQYEPAELLPNVMKVEWDEACILWLSVWWDVMGWGLYIVTVCVVGCYLLKDIRILQYELAELLPNVVKAEWDEGCTSWTSVRWDDLGIICSRPTAWSKVTIQHNHSNSKNTIHNQKYV